MSRSVFRPEKPHYTNLDERLRAHPYRMPDKDLCVEKREGVCAGPVPAWPEAYPAFGPGDTPPKPDTTRHMTRRQRALL